MAKVEQHIIDGQIKTLLVHRKGSTRAFPPNHPLIPIDYQLIGQPVLIGGTMGTCSYILTGTEKGGIMSREKVRERVEEWDHLPKHPDISHFGDPTHNEWKQFFIGDDSEPIVGKCPFKHKELD